MGKNIPSGGKPRQCFEHFEKCRFRHSETTDSFPKIGLKFPGNLWSAFLMMSYDVLQKKGICSWKGARCFSLSHRHALHQGTTGDLQKAFDFGVHPTPLPHPDASHQFWVHMAVGSGRETTWYGRLWQSPHRIDPTCANQNMFFSNSFLYTKHPFRVVASFMAPTKLVT